MSSQPRVVQTGALPPQTRPPLEAGSSNVFNSAIQKSNNQTASQMALIGGRKKRYRGGANSPVVQVAAAPSYAVNKDATNDINTQIYGLAVSNQNNAAFDGLTNGNSGNTAIIAAKQQETYTGNGGSKFKSKSKSRKHLKKGGYWPVWGCLSGGKKSRKSRSSRRRKTRKHMKRHRR
jgi:hypothetical protein